MSFLLSLRLRKRFLFAVILWLLLILFVPRGSFATVNDHTIEGERKGQEIYQKLTKKEISCRDFTDSDFETLGEFFMGKMAGTTHSAMNQMMEKMMGKEGEKQMHVVMGKRMSGCDTETKGGGNPMLVPSAVEGMGSWKMMGGWGGFGWGWIFMILFWLLVILAIVALVKWLVFSGKTESSKSPLDILKERYAKGEIEKKEYEEKAKVLSK